jgi:thiol-disulfide isomerase/thioredoxin
MKSYFAISIATLLFLSGLLLSGCGVTTTTDVVTPGKPSTPAEVPPSSDNITSDSGEETPSTNPEAPGESASGDKADSRAAGGSAADSKNASVSGEVTLIDDDGVLFQKYLQENKGKVILVDCWATWCGPCKEAFPQTVAWHKKYQAEGLVVVGVSFDDDGDDDAEKAAQRESALKFLKSQKATFKNFLAKTGIDAESGKPFGVTLQLPAYRLIDRKGADRLDKKMRPEVLEDQLPKLIEQLLQEPA